MSNNVCNVVGCVTEICTNINKNYCYKHYKRYKEYGSPYKKPKNKSGKRLTKFKRTVLKRDNYKCQVCGTSEDISVHHLLYMRFKNKLKYNPSNGIVLCKRHHKEVHFFDVPHSPKYISKMLISLWTQREQITDVPKTALLLSFPELQ